MTRSCLVPRRERKRRLVPHGEMRHHLVPAEKEASPRSCVGRGGVASSRTGRRGIASFLRGEGGLASSRAGRRGLASFLRRRLLFLWYRACRAVQFKTKNLD
ncbi:hypothetical protein GW17_00015394 [Ensete ventricosum]|nr:hypothetical protein GW17_00015394 [Ensete ventricosum]